MKTLQEKFFTTVEKRINEILGTELILEPTAANCGVAHIIAKEFFTPLVSFRYHFQQGHNTFTVAGVKPEFILVQSPQELDAIFRMLWRQLHHVSAEKASLHCTICTETFASGTDGEECPACGDGKLEKMDV